MSNHYPIVRLKERRERSLLRGHPWVFSGAISEKPANLGAGEIVDVCDSSGKFVACGYWSDGSIAVKILSFRRERIDSDYWRSSIGSAINLRKQIGLLDSSAISAFRLVHGEGDGIPGLIIDLYGATAVVQLQSFALRQFIPDITESLRSTLGNRLVGIVDKSLSNTHEGDRSLEKKSEDLGLIWGEEGNPVIIENSLNFKVDWRDGQKTGFFLDQRDNRAILKNFSKDRKILNAFCYSGAFSIYALSGGASFVTSLDASKSAMRLVEENLLLNTYSGVHQSVCSDYFSYIKDCSEKFDLIILDPPAFAKHRDAVDEAIKGYTNINYYALRSLNKNGLLMTYSCSQLVNWEMFWRAVQEAATRAGRFVRIIARLHQATCHPVSISHPEGDYLKGFLLAVE